MIEGLARFMFERQAASYDADPEMIDAAWEDPGVYAFWLAEAAAVLGHLDRDRTSMWSKAPKSW